MLKRNYDGKKTVIYKKLVLGLSVIVLLLGVLPQPVLSQSAGELQRQIEAKNAEIERSKRAANELRSRADTLENKLAILQAEIRQTQDQIDLTADEISQTQTEIKQMEADLARAKELIQQNVKQLYKQGDPSTLELLFSSENFSDFVSRQEYLDSVKDSLNEAAAETVRLKGELEVREADLTVKSNRLSGQKEQLDVKRETQQSLVNETRGEEKRYQNLVRSQEQEKERLEEQQRAAYAAAAAAAQSSGQFVSSGGGNYPWSSGPYPCWSSNCVDPWGLYFRECVSYTAWKVSSTGRYVPHFAGAGHANQWPSTAARHGIPSGSAPREGAVAIANIGVYGHSMYVEKILGNGMIRISEYNFLPGKYSVRDIPASGLTYIYF
ncbi:MAG: CHAP domain-containing protein [Candidatus Saccharimonadales bacterium]